MWLVAVLSVVAAWALADRRNEAWPYFVVLAGSALVVWMVVALK